MHWQGMCALKPSVVRICEDTHNHKPTWCELLSPTMQRHKMVVAMLSLGIMIEKRQHEWEDVTTAESLQLVTGPTSMAGKNTQNYVPLRFLCVQLWNFTLRETGCDPALPVQLCWSSSNTFPHICNTTIWKRNWIEAANLIVEGHWLNNLPVPSMPWRPCTNWCFFSDY